MMAVRLSSPYGETFVRVVAIEPARTPEELQARIDEAIRTLEEAEFLVVPPVAVVAAGLVPGEGGRWISVQWLVVTLRQGPRHPRTGFPGPEDDAMLERHGLLTEAGEP